MKALLILCAFLGLYACTKSGMKPDKLDLVDSYTVSSGFISMTNKSQVMINAIESLPEGRYKSRVLRFEHGKFKQVKIGVTNAEAYKNISAPVFLKYEKVIDQITNLKRSNEYSLLNEINFGVYGQIKIYIKPEGSHQFLSKLELTREGIPQSLEFEYGFVDSVEVKEINNLIFYFVTVNYCGASSCSSQISVYN